MANDLLLLESGSPDNLLLETGDGLLLESSTGGGSVVTADCQLRGSSLAKGAVSLTLFGAISGRSSSRGGQTCALVLGCLSGLRTSSYLSDRAFLTASGVGNLGAKSWEKGAPNTLLSGVASGRSSSLVGPSSSLLASCLSGLRSSSREGTSASLVLAGLTSSRPRSASLWLANLVLGAVSAERSSAELLDSAVLLLGGAGGLRSASRLRGSSSLLYSASFGCPDQSRLEGDPRTSSTVLIACSREVRSFLGAGGSLILGGSPVPFGGRTSSSYGGNLSLGGVSAYRSSSRLTAFPNLAVAGRGACLAVCRLTPHGALTMIGSARPIPLRSLALFSASTGNVNALFYYPFTLRVDRELVRTLVLEMGEDFVLPL